MKKIQLLLIGLAIIIFAACSNSSDSPGEETEPTDQNTSGAFATFFISIPQGTIPSKATDPGIADEYMVKTLHVFIYDSISPHTATLKEFTTADGSLVQTPTGWKTSAPVKTLKADKYIFAGINLTADIVNDITSKGFGAFSYKEFPQSVSDLSNPTNGFVMFNATYPAVTPANDLAVSPDAANASPVQIPVCRVVAKAAAFKGATFVVNGGGQMRNITYGWRNINKQFYFIQKVENGIIKDYNWDGYNANDFIRGTDAFTINENATTPTVFSYALENAFNYVAQVSKIDQSTFLSVSGQFKPDEIIHIKTGVTTPQTGADFETIANPNDYGTFYVVRTSDGIANYFIDASTAQQYATLCINGAAGMPSITGNYVLGDNTYDNGLCYYHLLVNSGATAPYTTYGVYRNQYYRVTINSIQAPGNPNDNFDDNEVIQPNTWVNVEIEVQDWEIVDENTDL